MTLSLNLMSIILRRKENQKSIREITNIRRLVKESKEDKTSQLLELTVGIEVLSENSVPTQRSALMCRGLNGAKISVWKLSYLWRK